MAGPLQGRLLVFTVKVRHDMSGICRNLQDAPSQDVAELGIGTNIQLGKDTNGVSCSFKIMWPFSQLFPHRTSCVPYNDSTKGTVFFFFIFFS